MSESQAVLPLSRESSSRLLPWIIGIMVYLGAVILAGAMVLAAAAAAWNDELTAAFTVQVTPIDGEKDGEIETRIQNTAKMLRNVPGVAIVNVVPAETTMAALEPWLGPNLKAQDLPLPRVIDVRLEQAGAVDLAALAKELSKDIKGIVVDSHEYWRGQIESLVRTLELLATVVIVLIGFSAMAAVVFATRSGVAVHRDVIEVLHLIGATDQYVAQQFQRQAFRVSLLGSLFGGLLAVITLFGFGRLLSDLDAVLLPAPTLAPWEWIALGVVPILACLIATMTARHTVIRALRRMP
jgi:cell division transport system permease protein